MNVVRVIPGLVVCALPWVTSMVAAQTPTPEAAAPAMTTRQALAHDKKVSEWPAGKISNLKGQPPTFPLITLRECLLLALTPRLHDGCDSGVMCWHKASQSGVCID
jgi:hypothetical protein